MESSLEAKFSTEYDRVDFFQLYESTNPNIHIEKSNSEMLYFKLFSPNQKKRNQPLTESFAPNFPSAFQLRVSGISIQC